MAETVPDTGLAWRLCCRIAALLCLPLAALVAHDSAVAFWATRSPESVPAVLRSNAQLHWIDIEHRSIDAHWLSAHQAEAKAAALAQLRVSPLTSSALRVLGQIEVLHDPDGGVTQFRNAERVTRRDALNQLQLILAASQSGDVADGMLHYDRIFATAPESKERLFSTLANAIAYAEVRAPLSTYASRPWFSQFLARAIDLGADPAATVDLYSRALRSIAPSDRPDVGLKLVSQLLTKGRLTEARGIAATIPGIGAKVRDEFALTTVTSNPSLAPLAWKLYNDEAVESAFNPPGELAIRVASGRPSVVAERTMLAEPGSYLLSHDVRYDSAEASAGLTWTVTCTSGIKLASLRIPTLPGRHRFSAAILVPAGCGAQSWQLTASPEDTQSRSGVAIDRLSLVPQ